MNFDSSVSLKRWKTHAPAGKPAPGLRLMVPALMYAIFVALTALGAPVQAFGGGLQDIPVCHGFGCRYKESASITEEEWNEIKAFFREPAKSPEEEREQIRKAAGWFEVIIGRHTPIHLDRPRDDYPGRVQEEKGGARGVKFDAPTHRANTVGQMDCIDDSLNMNTYLHIMDDAGLFKYHRAVERARRRSAYDQHYAGQIEEIETGKRWVVDSWFYGYGSLPVVESYEEWSDIHFFFGTAW